MSLSAILRLGKNQKNTIGAFEIDVTVSEVHNRASQITSNPIENGVTVSDHIINDPKTVNLTGVISNTPLALFGLGSDDARVQDAFDALEEIYDSRLPFDLQTGFKLYRNCFFTSLTMPKVRAGELRFTATLQEINIVETQITQIPSSQLDAADAALSSQNDAGRQQGQAVTENQQKSILAGVGDGLRSVLP